MLWRCHIDQLRSGSTTIPQQTDSDSEVPTGPLLDNRDEEPAPETGTSDTHTDSNDDAVMQTDDTAKSTGEQGTVDSTAKKYPSRVRHPPVRYQ